MNLVIIESPFKGRANHAWWPFSLIVAWLDRLANVRYARRCLRDSLMRCEQPFASHLLYTQRGVLRDDNTYERAQGIAAGFAWGRHARLVAVYLDRGYTPGMIAGIRRARQAGQPVEYRMLAWERCADVETLIAFIEGEAL